MEITAEMVREHGLTEGEYQLVVDTLDRTLTWTELGVLSVMWSEHCSYKSSRLHLRRLLTEGPRVVVGPGENAGIVSIGDGWCIAFKMESHNHPSYIEPYQGAATGVGGILRDVFTMGARPIAALNSLRFGSWEHPKTRHLLHGVVAGVGGYGNCFGVPTVGGELSFNKSYNGNCLVNAFVAGVVREDSIFLGTAAGVGNPVFYVGARTGRDGIHGATMASEEFAADSDAKRPTVQVGDPFQEKLLLEACLELMREDCIVGIQDMGAAGLTSSSVEMAGRGGAGMLLELERVPVREVGMTPYELLLSESQERMLMVIQEGKEDQVSRIFEKWDLQAAEIGRVTADGVWRCTWHGEEVCALPVSLLTDAAPCYDRPQKRPAALEELALFEAPDCPDPGGDLLRMLGSSEHCSRRWVYNQYDHQVGTNTVILPGADAAVVRVKGTDKAIAVSVDCNGRHVYLDPEEGSVGVIAEGARNLSCVGAVPIGASDCLNFGNPERPEIMWQFARAVDGLARGCTALEIPIVSGNVSLYNETDGSAILPTPSVAMVGLIDGPLPTIRGRFGVAGLEVAVLGVDPVHGVGASSWLAILHGQERGLPPKVDLEAERRLHERVRALIRGGLVEVAHDIFDGGFAVAVAECCLPLRDCQGVGFVGEVPGDGSLADRLFGEDHGRVLIAYQPSQRAAVQGAAGDVPLTVVGQTGGEHLVLDRALTLPVSQLTRVWTDALPEFARGDLG
jgi:phosphoribosylformylglycinamidine synthase